MWLDVKDGSNLFVLTSFYHRHGKHLSVACRQTVDGGLQFFVGERSVVGVAGYVETFNVRDRDGLAVGLAFQVTQSKACGNGGEP